MDREATNLGFFVGVNVLPNLFHHGRWALATDGVEGHQLNLFLLAVAEKHTR
jgi:hypothetical protein